jgi:UDP-N-acetylmuramoyl-tripeptide--D-alanyl-D-alanine ligase
MTEPLWSWADLVAGTRGRPEGAAAGGITGISIDTRTIAPGDLFVAIRGDNQDGHVYVSKAFEKGAAAALVSDDFVTPAGAGPLIRVDEPLDGLRRLGIAARARLAPDARVIAVTGSVGKTSTKDMLRRCLASVGPTHAAEKSYNNHWGVPLTLARMPAATKYGVFEVGMNHAGEITPLTKMVRPHVAIVTTVGPVHLEFFGSEEAIADAKAEIFEGLEPDGTAILNADNRHFERLTAAADIAGGKIIGFGSNAKGPKDFWLVSVAADKSGHYSIVGAALAGHPAAYALGVRGEHQAKNSLAVLAALQAVGLEPKQGFEALASFSATSGRGAREPFALRGGRTVLIDESYNANPLSMGAALAAVGEIARGDQPRRIAVLGDMRELGETSRQLHAALLQPITDANVDLVFACGPHMSALYDALPRAMRGAYAERSEGLVQPLLDVVRGGDVIMIKGSLGTRMAPIVDALKKHLSAMAATT